MATTRSTLSQISHNLDESLGLRGDDTRPKLSPIPSPKDVGRRPMRNFGRVAVDLVTPDPEQPRSEFSEEAIERLAQSIRDKGQLAPIRVRWAPALEKWVIISGERRWRATRQAGLADIECYFHDGDLNKSEILEQQLIENLLREDLSPLEEAKAYRGLMDLNSWNGKQVAEALRIPASKVSRALAILDLPEDILQSIESGKLSASTAYELTKLTNPDVLRELADQAIAGKLLGTGALNEVRKRRGKPKSAPRGTRQVFLADGGWRVTVSASKKGSYDEVEYALQLALDEVKTRIRSGMRLF